MIYVLIYKPARVRPRTVHIGSDAWAIRRVVFATVATKIAVHEQKIFYWEDIELTPESDVLYTKSDVCFIGLISQADSTNTFVK